ncbi:ribonuclease P protein subunit rpr2 isoform X2 [Fopius arisanus]|uniref:Ribonuclease P protein subunit rpr2 isoform X2 n=1 Tax=Fopius arisanus TaxID=64838 RepID=A0A9R1T913_9HYME|nr:PREDICTED: ribonuclease P protein subunit rpr2-like isoform X2 [Fopius arisanus]XP_011305015.1 PREDICTED: ribonuclease P protein subunit rpr2-like isoform X2 [Fopius arisanus]
MGEQLCQGKDVFERMNYLLQAGQLLSSMKDFVGSSLCGNMMVSCGKRSVLRMEPDIKRSICKCCQTPLIAGESARVRLISKPLKAVKFTCLVCGTTKMIPTKRAYKLWTDQPEAVIKIFHYTPKCVVAIDHDVEKIVTSEGLTVKQGNTTDDAILKEKLIIQGPIGPKKIDLSG